MVGSPPLLVYTNKAASGEGRQLHFLLKEVPIKTVFTSTHINFPGGSAVHCLTSVH